MCNPVQHSCNAMARAKHASEYPVEFGAPMISIDGTVSADGGLRASLSSSQGVRLHLERQTRYVLRPQAASTDLTAEAGPEFRSLPRLEGECARLGLLRLLRLPPPSLADRSQCTLVLCTLILWAQEMACELDLRGGVSLCLDIAWAPILADSHCRWVTMLFGRSLKQRVELEISVAALSDRIRVERGRVTA
ncbi:hypothetical protein C7435_1858 [Maricaulis maris]|uniref:Uncharacterized protein n=1 Tax=Maricaulis maris TaxID=74318 RepID=A0A495D5U1_9PROT|nr:hypothetical protein C7435_1858 [Maricaulis maris]